MIGIPIHLFLDFNAVIVNLDSLSPEQQRDCISDIEKNIQTLKVYLEDHLKRERKAARNPRNGSCGFEATAYVGRGNRSMDRFLEKKIEFTWNRRPFKFSILLFRALGTEPNKI